MNKGVWNFRRPFCRLEDMVNLNASCHSHKNDAVAGDIKLAETCSTVAILPGNYLSEQYYRPEGSLPPENCECGCRLLWSVEPFKKQPALTVFQVQAAFGKIRTLVAPSPQPSIAHNASASPPSAYCNTSRLACNSYSASPPSTSRSAVCNLPVICGYGRAWRCLCGAHVKHRLPENRL